MEEATRLSSPVQALWVEIQFGKYANTQIHSLDICPTKAFHVQNRTFQLLPEDPSTEWQTEDARYKQSHQLRLPKGSFVLAETFLGWNLLRLKLIFGVDA